MENSQPKSEQAPIKIKPWGHEVWFAHHDNFAGKVLFIKKGHRYSLQYHEHKEETQYLFQGKVKFTVGPSADQLEEIILEPGDKITIKPPMIHRAEALEDSYIFEASSAELDDVVKLADDYGRTGKGNDEELDKKIADSN